MIPKCLPSFNIGMHGGYGHAGNTEIGVVVDGRIRNCYLGFNHTPIFTCGLVLKE